LSNNPSGKKRQSRWKAEAKRRYYNPVQLALAWLLQKSRVMLSIPGTANISPSGRKHGRCEHSALPEEWKEIEGAG